MKKTIFFLTVLFLAACLAFGTGGQQQGGTAARGVPGYLNMDSIGLNGIPIVKNGQTQTVNVAVSKTSTQGAANQIWTWEYFRRAHNIDARVEQIVAPAEYRALTFAAGDLPDVMINMGITGMDLVMYGMGEGLILKADEYIAGYMPNLSDIYAKFPLLRNEITLPDGHIYGLGTVYELGNPGMPYSIYSIKTALLKEIGIPEPTTLDEFIEMARAVKKYYPDNAPIMGGYNVNNPCGPILGAFGWVTNDPKGLTPAIRNGKVVFPYGDREIYGEYLKTMNTLYSENLILSNFYTATSADVNVQWGTGKTVTNPGGVNGQAAVQWEGIMPLTSRFNSTRVWPGMSNPATFNVWIMSAKTRMPELLCKWYDFWFDNLASTLMVFGPMKGGNIDTYGLTDGWFWDTEINDVAYEPVRNDPENRYQNNHFNYRQAHVAIGDSRYGNRFTNNQDDLALMAGVDFHIIWSEQEFSPQNRPNWNKLKQMPYWTNPYPGNIFFTLDVNRRITDLSSVINSYVETETARFITGVRSLTDAELNAYFNGLDALGYQEYLKYYVDYYDAREK